MQCLSGEMKTDDFVLVWYQCNAAAVLKIFLNVVCEFFKCPKNNNTQQPDQLLGQLTLLNHVMSPKSDLNMLTVRREAMIQRWV